MSYTCPKNGSRKERRLKSEVEFKLKVKTMERGLVVNRNYGFGYDTNILSSSSSSLSLFNSLFTSALNLAAAQYGSSCGGEKWKPSHHFRFIRMMLSWFSLWLLRLFMDLFPAWPRRLLPSSASSSVEALPPSLLPSSGALLSLPKPLDLVPYQTVGRHGAHGASLESLSRALSQMFALINEVPANSSKYQFAMGMAEKLLQDNARDFQIDLLQVNRTALASAFARTSILLQRSLQRMAKLAEEDAAGMWPARLLEALPLGSYVAPYLRVARACVRAVMSVVGRTETLGLKKSPRVGIEIGVGDEYSEAMVVAEKLGEELLWMTNKLRDYGAVEEAIEQWSFSSGLASLSMTANPRVQASFLKISVMVMSELTRAEIHMSSEGKLRILLLWLPLLCAHSTTGVAFPMLTTHQKTEAERAINHIIGSLPASDQELVLGHWLHHFSLSASDWPDLHVSYERWCQLTRNLLP